MANKRSLKREINNLCTALLAECEAVRLYGKTNEKDLQSIVMTVFRVYGNAICRVSHPEPGVPVKAYFKDLRVTFVQQVEEIVEQLNALA